MSAEAWIALGTGIVTILTIVFFAGSIVAELKMMRKDFSQHVQDDKVHFNNLYESAKEHGELLSSLKTASGMHLEAPRRRGQSGGHATV